MLMPLRLCVDIPEAAVAAAAVAVVGAAAAEHQAGCSADTGCTRLHRRWPWQRQYGRVRACRPLLLRLRLRLPRLHRRQRRFFVWGLNRLICFGRSTKWARAGPAAMTPGANQAFRSRRPPLGNRMCRRRATAVPPPAGHRGATAGGPPRCHLRPSLPCVHSTTACSHCKVPCTQRRACRARRRPSDVRDEVKRRSVSYTVYQPVSSTQGPFSCCLGEGMLGSLAAYSR